MNKYFVFLLIGILVVSGCVQQKEELKDNKINAEIKSGASGEKKEIDIYPEIWSQNSVKGQSYEFKVNCGPNYDKLETCFLWELDAVKVIDPSEKEHVLKKDFNMNSYSGEVTRRWVLYGPQKAELPKPGKYIFNYYKDGKINLTQRVDYKPEVIDFPKNVKWRRDGNNLLVEWLPPAGVKPGIWYKVIVFPKKGNLISKQFDWEADSGALENLPLSDGDEAEFNVAIFFRGGYAYTENIQFIWKSNKFGDANTQTFFEDDGVVFEHYWPLDPVAPNMKADESEILVYNDGDSNAQIISTDMVFLLDEKPYSQYSGTWEKFPSKSSWERIDYVNIKPDYYKGEPLILQPGQKGKIHYHYQFEGDISNKKHSVQINIVYKIGGVEKKIDKKLERARGMLPSKTNTVSGGQSEGGH